MSGILFLAHRIPFPPDRGDKIRSWHILRHLAGLGRVHLACFADDAADAAHLPALRQALGGRLGEAHVEIRRTRKALAAARALLTAKPLSLTLFASPMIHRFVHRMLAKPEVESVFTFSGQMAQFVPARPRQRWVMDFVDMDSAKFEAYAGGGGPLAAMYRREAKRLFAFERGVAARADASLFVSEAEAALFRARANLPLANIQALSNGVDVDFYDPAAVAPAAAPQPLIVFTGQMDYQPNVDAVLHFAAETLPRLMRGTFAIVGRNPPDAIRRLASDRVIVTGAVPDVRPWLAAADVVVAPLRIARGIQNKVLEAMAMARPVVATQAAFEGIEAEPGRDLLVADGADAQAGAIQRLLDHPDKAAALGNAARRRIEQAYRWDVRLEPLAALCLPAREVGGEGDHAKHGGVVTDEACSKDPSTTFADGCSAAGSGSLQSPGLESRLHPPPHRFPMGRQGRAA
ncbi:MAG: TIGR03087 family PEP-CTERM/XrtA system glycosyltransferase [Alphaproteobacteria bacterium]|nr:TIGR03087 family PEP-CTERM/XrtA system glycosyltransferase [Alphaproteobacteria bacterium]